MKKYLPTERNFKSDSFFCLFQTTSQTALALPGFLLVSISLLSNILCIVTLKELQFRAPKERKSWFFSYLLSTCTFISQIWVACSWKSNHCIWLGLAVIWSAEIMSRTE